MIKKITNFIKNIVSNNQFIKNFVLVAVLIFCLVILRIIAGAGDDFGGLTLQDLKQEYLSTVSGIARLVDPTTFKSNITSLFTPSAPSSKTDEPGKSLLGPEPPVSSQQSGTISSENCAPGNDPCFLFNQSRGELEIEIFNTSRGQTFTAYSETLPLRQNYSDESFYVDNSGGNVQINYSIIEKTGGVDIVYTLFNPTLAAQKLPEFRVEGLRHLTTGTLNRLSPVSGNLVTMYENNSLVEQFNNQYPGNYSPVMLMHDQNFASGVALMYPYLNFKHDVDMQLRRMTGSGPQNGTWRYRYWNMKDSNEEEATIAPLEYRQYTISTRFSKPRHWVLTLRPYKEYFISLYKGFGGTFADRDKRVICGQHLTNSGSPQNEENPRGYNYNLHIHDQGWQPYINDLISVLKERGYERTMFWTAAGRYRTPHNFPMQFMNFLPELERGSFHFDRLAGDGISLGFWWGRAGEVPDPIDNNGWDPENRKTADLSNIEHLRFLATQLIKAKKRGAEEIGLDYITAMAPYQRYVWVDIMERLAPGVNFAHESTGPDFMHSKISNYLNLGLIRPTYKVEGPDVLSWYLNNGGSQIWVNTVDPGSQMVGDFETFQKLISWGFTPISMSNRCSGDEPQGVDVTNINYNLTPCFDGKAPEWPYDCECLSAVSNPDLLSCS